MSRNRKKTKPTFQLKPVDTRLNQEGLLSWQSIMEEADAREQKNNRRRGQNRGAGGYSLQEIADPFLTVGSAIAGSTAGGVAGLGAGLYDAATGGANPLAAANDAMGSVTDRLTYHPRTVRGQENLQTGLDWVENNSVLNAMEAGQQYLGDKTLEYTGSPALATMAHMSPDIVEGLLGLGPSLNAGRKVSRALEGISPRVVGSQAAKMGGNQGGAIGGAGAKGLNPLTKRLVDDMTNQGHTPEQIWEATGGITGQPAWIDSQNRFKFEFDDSKARFKEQRFENVYEALEPLDGRTKDVKALRKMLGDHYSLTPSQRAAQKPGMNAIKDRLGIPRDLNTLGAQFDHPGLYYNYPELKGMKYSEDFMRSNEQGWYNTKDNEMAVNLNMSPEEKRSTILHEGAAHGPQGLEGFARGGSPAEFAKEKNQAEIRARGVIAELDKARIRLEANPDDSKLRARVKVLESSLDTHLSAVDKYELQTPFEMYENLLGEDEARAVEKRMNLSMDERLKRPFWLDMDSQRGNHIIRYDK